MGAYLDLAADVGVDEVVESVPVDVEGQAGPEFLLCVLEGDLEAVDILDDELDFEKRLFCLDAGVPCSSFCLFLSFSLLFFRFSLFRSFFSRRSAASEALSLQRQAHWHYLPRFCSLNSRLMSDIV